MVGPLVAIIFINVKTNSRHCYSIPLIALPVGGICGILAMGKIKHINKYATYGLAKMSGVAIRLIGTGTLAGIIANSGLTGCYYKWNKRFRITKLYVSSQFQEYLCQRQLLLLLQETAVAASVFRTDNSSN